MNAKLNKLIWSQFGAAIDMVRNAINDCPEDLWSRRDLKPEYWYLAYHTLFWLDFYLTDSPDAYRPYRNIGLTEFDPAGIIPDKVFTKPELLEYLEHGRTKCENVISLLTDAKANERYEFNKMNFSFLELLLYNMRHAQHHAAQMNLILRQQIDYAPGWVSKAGSPD